MKTWSVSQNKFIDAPSTEVSAPVDTGSSDFGDMTSLGIPKSKLQNIFFALGSKNPKSISSLSGLLNLVSPSASEIKGKTDAAQTKKETQQGVDAMNETWKLYKKMTPLELNFVPYGVAGKLPRVAPNKAAINTLFYTIIEPALRKQVVGGRATQQEIQWFKDALFPTATDTDKTYKQRWTYAMNRFKSVMSDTSTPDTTSGSDTTTPQSNLDSLYNQTLGQ